MSATPKIDRGVRDGVKQRVVDAETFEDGLAEWSKSFQSDVESNGFRQAWMDHFRSLNYLHKVHIKPQEKMKKKEAKKQVIDAISKVADMLVKVQPKDAAVAGVTLDDVWSGKAAAPVAASATPADGKKSKDKSAKASLAAAAPVAASGAVASVSAATSAKVDINEKELKKIKESDGTQVKYYIAEKFENWGKTIHNKPAVTFAPVSRGGVQNIVKWAITKNLRVRASGYRHTWSDMYSEENAILITMLPLNEATRIPVFAQPKIVPNEEDLEGIKIVGEVTEGGVTKALCRIGASTTNDQFRTWCLDKSEHGGQWKWTIPLNVIMVEITWGGSNSPICHGAGIKHETLSDLVHSIEFCDVHGNIQVVDDPHLLRAASGAFGLLGIVTAVTMKLDKMSYAAMHPTKTPLVLGVPPPVGWAVPKEVDQSWAPSQVEKATADFAYHCEHDYYAEWFWFPLQKQTWNNCWHNDGKEADAKEISEWKVLTQEVQGFAGNLFNVLFGKLFPKLQLDVMTWSAMTVMPDLTGKPPATVPLIEGLHFRRGIQNMRVVDMELEIPIPGRKDDPSKPDWSLCQVAWWQVVNLIYEYERNEKYPCRIALEMRVMGGSNVIMAPQYGNTKDGYHGTCSIEVLTTPQTDAALWNEFMQKVTDGWVKLGIKGSLHTRSHWAKQWQGLNFDGKDAITYAKTVAYKDRIPEFVKTLKKVGKEKGFTWDEMKARYSNPLLDKLFFE